MANAFRQFGSGMAMRNRLDGYGNHITPRPDNSLAMQKLRLRTLGSLLWAFSLLHLVFVTLLMLGALYLATYYYLIQLVDFPKEHFYLQINELHHQWLHHPIDDRDLAYFLFLLIVFVVDNLILQGGNPSIIAWPPSAHF
jgi:hypothetical protein